MGKFFMEEFADGRFFSLESVFMEHFLGKLTHESLLMRNFHLKRVHLWKIFHMKQFAREIFELNLKS